MTTRLPAVALLLAATSAALAAEPIAFPGAEGFGAKATGGRGGETVIVTTLNDSGPGSLRDALSKPGRTILFAVAGTIKLESNLAIPDNTTLAGESAPGQGITLYNNSVSCSERKNIIVRHLRFRAGINSDRGKCSINIANGSNMIFDHCSVQWGRWDSLGCTKESHDITFQNCIIGEAIDPQRFGALVDSVKNITLARNLWINNQSRNPKAKGAIQYINNVVYNWGVTGLAGGHSEADHQLEALNNYFIAGPSSTGNAIAGFSSSDKVHDAGNLIDLDKDGKPNGRPVTRADYNDDTGGPSTGGTGGVAIPPGQKPYPTFVAERWSKDTTPVPVTLDTAEDALKHVIASAGASRQRDAVDKRLIDELQSFGTKGKIIKTEAELGELPKTPAAEAPKDSDHDGIPDAYESAHALHPNDPADAPKLTPAGYSHLETYLHSLCK